MRRSSRTLEEIVHAHMIDDRFGELFEELEPYAASLPYDSDDASLIRVAHRDWDRARRVPAELAVEFAKVAAESYEVWVKAREDSDFAPFRPWLERVVDLRRQYIECFAPYDDPYDVLLEDYEPGMRTSEIREIFAVLAPELQSLVAEHATDEEDAFLDGPFPIDAQDALSRELVEAFGATWDQFRLDPTVHPFEITFGLGDIRLTTRYAENELNSLFTAMHETGHGIYEWGVSKTLERTPLAAGVSATLHESQSRLWENVVGRSLPFWRWFYPRVQETFPEQLSATSRSSSSIARSTAYAARASASTPTRRATGSMSSSASSSRRSSSRAGSPSPTSRTRGTPASRSSWASRCRTTRWASSRTRTGRAGASATSRPTSSARCSRSRSGRRRARRSRTSTSRSSAASSASCTAWLRENIYSLGRKLTPAETVERVVGGPIDPQPYLAYLRDKFELFAPV